MTRTPPIDSVVASMVKRLPEHLQELWLERAAIRQYDGGQSRDLADAMALLDVVRMHPQEALTCWLRTVKANSSHCAKASTLCERAQA